MGAVAHAGHADAAALRRSNRLLHGPAGDNEAEAIVAIDMGGGRHGVCHADIRPCAHEAAAQAIGIDRNAGNAMGADTTKIGQNQIMRDGGRVLPGNAEASENCRHAGLQPRCIRVQNPSVIHLHSTALLPRSPSRIIRRAAFCILLYPETSGENFAYPSGK
jgi:hypothetical protein